MTDLTTPILTVSLNAAIDVVYTLPRLTPGAIHIAMTVDRVAGGKANNVARVLARLGRPVLATGFAGGAAGRFLLENLTAQGIATDYERMAGENRSCLTILGTEAGSVTELRERGPTLTEQDGDRFVQRFTRLLGDVGLVVISGSLPPGLPPAFYHTLVSLAKERELPVILDASGKALQVAIEAGPTLVKPNRDELAEWAGRPLPALADVIEAARVLAAAGPAMVAVSLGADGIILITATEALVATPPLIQARNTVGSGDSAVAGLAAALSTGASPADALRLAVACGTANALTDGVAEVDPATVEQIRTQVQLRSL